MYTRIHPFYLLGRSFVVSFYVLKYVATKQLGIIFINALVFSQVFSTALFRSVCLWSDHFSPYPN